MVAPLFFLLATKYIDIFPALKPFLKKISSSAPGDESSILRIPVWKLYECPSLSEAKFIQLISLLKYYSQLKSGQSIVDTLYYIMRYEG
jgi:hypothetical protein